MIAVDETVEKKQIDVINLYFGLFVLLSSFVVYLLTVQQTLSFWDCGEYIACSYILGVPHPPGNPLFVLIGRLFSILPVAADIGFRVNLLSVVSSAFAAMFGYFIVVKLVKDWFGEEFDTIRRIGAYAAGLIGALLMAFSYTNWNSAVEAEVYGLSMLAITLIIWLVLTWVEKRHESGSSKYLILIAYLGSLSIGVHLAAFLILPMVFLLILLVDKSLRRNWMFWVTCAVLLVPLMSITKFMYISAAWAVISGLIYFMSGRNKQLAVPFLMVLAGFTAFTVHTYVPIRAELRPAINENAPTYKDWGAFERFLDRKQYGQESMVERMFERRGDWSNQFGTHRRMGFWGFFWKQYGITGHLFTFTLFPLGLIGLGELLHRRWKKGVPIFLMVLAATVGLVIYMNFADGTMQGQLGADDAHLEVRDRDYFWQSGFVLFALAIGIGFAGIWDMVYSGLRRRRDLAKLTLGLLLALVLPVAAVAKNYQEMDRSNNFIPYDYAYNLLVSADSNAVVFTNGDNDTFPVWCLQEVYGIRQDVRIANLSLINTSWYIKQLKNELGVPISFTNAQIDGLRHTRTSDGRLMRIQDIMIDNIIETNRWKEPIHFAVTVSDHNRLYKGKSIDDHLEMTGMMYRLTRESGRDMIDAEETVRLYTEEYKYRGVADSTIYKDENSARLTNNYAAGFMYAADMMKREGKIEDALKMMRRSIEIVPGSWQSYAYLMQLYSDLDSLDTAAGLLARAPRDGNISQLWVTLANEYWLKQRKNEAYDLLKTRLAVVPDDKTVYGQLMSFYYRDQAYDSLESLLALWLDDHPDDSEASAALTEVRKLTQPDTAATGIEVKQVDVPSQPSDTDKTN